MTRKMLRRVNIARPICHVLVGKEHGHGHRMAVGAATMLVGVTIARVTGEGVCSYEAYFGDLLGYAVHGLGLVPFIDFLIDMEGGE